MELVLLDDLKNSLGIVGVLQDIVVINIQGAGPGRLDGALFQLLGERSEEMLELPFRQFSQGFTLHGGTKKYNDDHNPEKD